MSLCEPFISSYINKIESTIDLFLNDQIRTWNGVDTSIVVPINALRNFINTGGKRLRPLFCLLGYQVAGGENLNDDLINVACSLEFLHSFALIHDDFMDRADSRRFKPTVHKQLLLDYSSQDYHGDIEHFSNSVAILTGDFAFSYADSFMRTLPLRCREIYDKLKIELFAGQQMDLDAVYRNEISQSDIILIAQYKSGRYTIERPLQLGSLLAKSNPSEDLWNLYGKPLGQAFQLRDDILGIFGDENDTGKPVGDDIREGKYTLLICEALKRADSHQRKVLSKRGNPDISDKEINNIVNIIRDTNALKVTEKRIEELYSDAIEQLQQFDLKEEVNQFALDLADHVCWRQL